MKISTILVILIFSLSIAFGNIIQDVKYNINASDICANETLILKFPNTLVLNKYSIVSLSIKCINIEVSDLMIEKETFDNMPNLKYLDLRLDNIPSDLFSFGNNSNLEILRLGYQNRQYDYDTVRYNYGKIRYDYDTDEQIRITNIYPELQLLDLEYANIYEFKSKLENPFPKLTHLFLAGNTIQNNFIKDLSLHKLTYLDLSHNKISRFSFKELNNLSSLILDNNNIQKIGGNIFSNDISLNELKKLENLSLANNQINYLDNDTFEQTTNLRYLNLRNNRLYNSNLNILKSLKFLEILVLDNNSFESVPIRTPLNITTLSLNFNKIEYLIYSSFVNMQNLRKLYLNENKISIIDVDAFQTQKLLEELYLSDNQLNFLPTNWYRSMKNLRYLNLSGNKFISLEMVIPNLPTKVLYLDRNPIQFINSSIYQIIPKDMIIYLNINSCNNL